MKHIYNHSILFGFGVNHSTASIEVREKVYVREDEIAALLDKLKETLEECIVISTCNRTEIYGVHPSSEIDFDFYKQILIDFKSASDSVTFDDFFSFLSCSACEQIFKVATSINSKIVGDTQILQQVRQSYLTAKAGGYTGKILNQLFQRALKIGKKTYLETSIHKGAVSVSLAAIELARENFESLADKTVMVIGAGETAQLTIECLLKNRIGKLLVTNRTGARSDEFLEKLRESHEFNGQAVKFENFRDYLNETDIVISSTSSPDYILNAGDFANQKRKILLIDIAVPRDIDPDVTADSSNVVLKNIDDLNTVVGKNYEMRMSELGRVNKIIYEEMGEFLMWYYALPLLPVVENRGTKPSPEQIREIKRIKEFLEANVKWFRRMMSQQKDVESELSEHLKLVEYLHALKDSIPSAASMLMAEDEGVCSFEK